MIHPAGIMLGRGPLERLWWRIAALLFAGIGCLIPVSWAYGSGWRHEVWLFVAARRWGYFEMAEGRL